MRRAQERAQSQAQPCIHEDAWVPTAILFGGKRAEAEVYCMSCEWTGRVPLAKVQNQH